MSRSVYPLALIFNLTILPACASREGTVRARAAQDLDCPEHRIQVHETTRGRYRAAGCGQREDYRDESRAAQPLERPPCRKR